jgi:iron complex outermembrane receptor protein
VSGAWFDDYRTGNGDWVDADVQTVGAAGSFVWTGNHDHSANLAFVVNRQILVRNASLPLDLKDTPMVAITLDTAWKTDPATWKVRIGYTDTRPFLTSEDRPKLAPVPIDLVTADAKAANLAGGISRESSVGTAGSLEMGADLNSQKRDSVRTRFFASGAHLFDHIWPEVESTHVGLFGEFRWDEPDRYRVVGGVRIDRTWSDALAADDPVVGIPGARGDTIRENYGAFNGPDAMITKRDDWTGAAQVLFEAPVDSKNTTWYTGAGVTVAPPGTSERYRAFLNALGGGMEVGNPSLDSETRWELDLGIRMRGEGWRLDVGGFLALIDGFIQREAIASGPLAYGFRNRDVQMTGVELISEWAPPALAERGLRLDGSISAVWGENRETSTGIPEMPPWNLRLGLAWENSDENPRYSLSLGTRIVGSRTNPDPATMPLYRNTDSYMLWCLDGRVRIGSGWSLDLSVENMFDQRYFEYLQAPVAEGAFGPSSGTLKNGDSVPGFGRQVILSVRKRF